MIDDHGLSQRIVDNATAFADLARQAKSDESYAYAVPRASDIAMCLFRLSMMTKQELGMEIPRTNLLSVITKIESLQSDSNNRKQPHRFVRTICDEARSIIEYCIPYSHIS